MFSRKTTVIRQKAWRVTCPCGCKHRFTVQTTEGDGMTPAEARKIVARMDAFWKTVDTAFRRVFSPRP